MGCNPKFCPELPHSKCEDGSQEEVLWNSPDYAAVAHVQMHLHL